MRLDRVQIEGMQIDKWANLGGKHLKYEDSIELDLCVSIVSDIRSIYQIYTKKTKLYLYFVVGLVLKQTKNNNNKKKRSILNLEY